LEIVLYLLSNCICSKCWWHCHKCCNRSLFSQSFKR